MFVQLIRHEDYPEDVGQAGDDCQDIGKDIVGVFKDVVNFRECEQHHVRICQKHHIADVVPPVPQQSFINEAFH